MNLVYKGPDGSGELTCSMDSIPQYSTGQCTGEARTSSGALGKLSSTTLSAKIECDRSEKGVEVYTLDLKHKPWLSHLIFGSERDLGQVTITLNKKDGSVEVSGNFKELGYTTTDTLVKLFARCTERPGSLTCNGNLSGKGILPSSFHLKTEITESPNFAQTQFSYAHDLEIGPFQSKFETTSKASPLHFSGDTNFLSKNKLASTNLKWGGSFNGDPQDPSAPAGNIYFQVSDSSPFASTNLDLKAGCKELDSSSPSCDLKLREDDRGIDAHLDVKIVDGVKEDSRIT